jgi:hypothetical protein
MNFPVAQKQKTFMKMALFWVVAQCGLVKFIDISEVNAASIITANTSETLVNFYHTTQPEDSRLHSRCLENWKSLLENLSAK